MEDDILILPVCNKDTSDNPQKYVTIPKNSKYYGYKYIKIVSGEK